MAKNKNPFLLDCPICREPALPQQHDEGGYRLIHSTRIAPCRVKDGTDAAQNVRTRLDEWFGGAYTDTSPQALTAEIITLTEWGKEAFAPIDSDEWERYRDSCYRGAYPEIDTWEGEGGYIHLATHPD